MANSLWIFLGSGVGGMCRYWLSYLVYFVLGRQFPIGTLFINVSGSLLMGILYVLVLERSAGLAHIYQPLFLVGVLGGYTTFSSFSIESVLLFEAGNYGYAIANIFLSVSLCLGATWLGLLLARQL